MPVDLTDDLIWTRDALDQVVDWWPHLLADRLGTNAAREGSGLSPERVAEAGREYASVKDEIAAHAKAIRGIPARMGASPSPVNLSLTEVLYDATLALCQLEDWAREKAGMVPAWRDVADRDNWGKFSASWLADHLDRFGPGQLRKIIRVARSTARSVRQAVNLEPRRVWHPRNCPLCELPTLEVDLDGLTITCTANRLCRESGKPAICRCEREDCPCSNAFDHTWQYGEWPDWELTFDPKLAKEIA